MPKTPIAPPLMNPDDRLNLCYGHHIWAWRVETARRRWFCRGYRAFMAGTDYAEMDTGAEQDGWFYASQDCALGLEVGADLAYQAWVTARAHYAMHRLPQPF